MTTATGPDHARPATGGGSSAPVLVVGYDDQPSARHVLGVAVDAARRTDGRLLVVHALPVLPVLPPTPVAGGAALGVGAAYAVPRGPDETGALGAAARERAAHELDPSGVPWSWVCAEAAPALLLQEQADAVDAWAVVVGAGGHGFGAALQHLLTGSTSEQLHKHARRPVLLVPEPVTGEHGRG